MNLVKIAYRNVSRQKRRSNLLALAIGFGVMIIILVNSLTTGLVTNTRSNFESLMGGHVYISGEMQLDSGRVVSRIDDTAVLDAVIPQFDTYIVDSQKRTTISGTFVFRSSSERGMLYGVNWEQETALIESLNVIDGSLDRIDEPGTIVLPEEVAEELGVILNENILLSFETVTGQANVGEFSIIAITKGTAGLVFPMAYADIRFVNEMFGLQPDEYQNYTLMLTDINIIDKISEQIQLAIEEQGVLVKPEPEDDGQGFAMPGPGMMFGAGSDEADWEGTRFDVGNLNDFMDIVTQVVNILNMVAMGVFLIMLLITGVGLLNTFRMIMMERTKEIGTMRSVGMLRKNVVKLFLYEGLILAMRGALFGIIAAVAIGLIIGAIPFTDSANPALTMLMSDGHISVPLVPAQMLLVTGIIAVITLIAVWSPARKAAKMKPADALRV
jgi:putative ABC transport system permease protein